MYAIFLLVLLADVARSHATVPMAGDAAGGLMLAASQLQPGPIAGNAMVSSRPERGFPSLAGLSDYRLAFSAWSLVLKSRAHSTGNPGWTDGAGLSNGGELRAEVSSAAFAYAFTPDDSSLAVFPHTGSPAP
jgi:hypothetical protein